MMSKQPKMVIPFSPPDITDAEIREVIEAMQSGWITTGPKTKQFEKELAEFSETNKFVCLNSATAALELTLRLLGIGPGDEVIVPAYTYTASCSPICHVGATPIMIDVKKDSFEMDYDKLPKLITSKTKAIIPVDLAGILCNYDILYKKIEEVQELYRPTNELQKCFKRPIVISDCAHGFGAIRDGKKAGNFADFTTFSFHAVKNLTTAEGGAVTWLPIIGVGDDWIYKQYQLLSLHGQTKDALNKNQLGAWEYDVVAPYYKCNMTDIHAGIGLAQLKRYKEMMNRRQEIINKYDVAFRNKKIRLLNHKDNNHISSGHLYLTRIEGVSEQQRNEIINKMASCGIACNVHYKSLPMLSAYKDLGFKVEDFPNAYDLYHNEISLPLYSSLTDIQLDYIIANFIKVLEEYEC